MGERMDEVRELDTLRAALEFERERRKEAEEQAETRVARAHRAENEQASKRVEAEARAEKTEKTLAIAMREANTQADRAEQAEEQRDEAWSREAKWKVRAERAEHERDVAIRKADLSEQVCVENQQLRTRAEQLADALEAVFANLRQWAIVHPDRPTSLLIIDEWKVRIDAKLAGEKAGSDEDSNHPLSVLIAEITEGLERVTDDMLVACNARVVDREGRVVRPRALADEKAGE